MEIKMTKELGDAVKEEFNSKKMFNETSNHPGDNSSRYRIVKYAPGKHLIYFNNGDIRDSGLL